MNNEMTVMLRSGGGDWQEPAVTTYGNERELQDILVKHVGDHRDDLPTLADRNHSPPHGITSRNRRRSGGDLGFLPRVGTRDAREDHASSVVAVDKPAKDSGRIVSIPARPFVDDVPEGPASSFNRRNPTWLSICSRCGTTTPTR